MATRQEIEVQNKKEVAAAEEATRSVRYYVPSTDIHETDEALAISMEVPGVLKDGVEVTLEKDVLKVVGQVDSSNYEGLEPIYTEYEVGHFQRSRGAFRSRTRSIRAPYPPGSRMECCNSFCRRPRRRRPGGFRSSRSRPESIGVVGALSGTVSPRPAHRGPGHWFPCPSPSHLPKASPSRAEPAPSTERSNGSA